MFESSVNSEGIEAAVQAEKPEVLFESSVNSEGIEALIFLSELVFGLRAV